MLPSPKNNTFTTYTFGSIKASVSKGEYRYGFQRSEADDEIKGDGNSYTTEFRQLDTRLGRWLSTDPITHAMYSPYSAFDNNPIYYVDPSGADSENETKDDLNNDTKVDEIGSNSIIPRTSIAEDEKPKKITKSELGIDEKKTAEKNIPALLDKMKVGEYLEGNDLDFIEPKAGYRVDKIKKTGDNTFEIVPTFMGSTVIDKGTTVTITKGTTQILTKVDGKNVGTEETGYWISLKGVKISGQEKVFLKGNTLYWQTKKSNGAKTYSKITLKK